MQVIKVTLSGQSYSWYPRDYQGNRLVGVTVQRYIKSEVSPKGTSVRVRGGKNFSSNLGQLEVGYYTTGISESIILISYTVQFSL